MDIKRKLELAEASIKSITTHDDEDSIVRMAAVEHLRDFLKNEEDAIAARANKKAGLFRNKLKLVDTGHQGSTQ